LLPGRIEVDTSDDAGLSERYRAYRADRLHAGHRAQSSDHARVEVVRLLWFEALELDRSQRMFIDTALHVHGLDAASNQEARVA
jgi:hypothetical protein